MFSDENGKLSSTRIVLFVALTMFVWLTIYDAVNEVTIEAMTYTIIHSIIMLCLGGTAVRSTVKNLKGK